MVIIFSSPPFYTNHIILPTGTEPVPPQICNNPKFWPYFKDAIGAIDGSHFLCSPPAYQRPFHWNQKGFISINCLFMWTLLSNYLCIDWLGGHCNRCSTMARCSWKGSSYSWRKIFTWRCRIFSQPKASYTISRCSISPGRVGACTFEVFIYFILF